MARALPGEPVVDRWRGRCYSPRSMALESPVKALLCGFGNDVEAAAHLINRLKPDLLCFFAPESSKPLIEQQVQPKLAQMPRRWDILVTPDSQEFLASYQTLVRALPTLLQTWEVHRGELVVAWADASPAMVGALILAGLDRASRVVQLLDLPTQVEPADASLTAATEERWKWIQGNPWDEGSVWLRKEASDLFNKGSYEAATSLFKQLEQRVSGGQKPLYRAFADLAEGYGLWHRFQYRPAWDKLKTSHKALEMASVWGGPPGLKELIPALKANAGFLERLVLDPQEVKEQAALDLLAQARRRGDQHGDSEEAMIVLLRALEAFAQRQLFKRYKIKTWDVQPEQLPDGLRETCRTCYLDDVDGKYKLPLQAQFRALAGLGDQMGQVFLAQWPKMKPLLDAANRAVLGHGFEPVKMERFQQLCEIVVKLADIPETSLPKFPVLNV
ncbi:MAG: TIGR02710 family CRISPR-associated CARF protein [Nitrospiraceae bacterium]